MISQWHGTVLDFIIIMNELVASVPSDVRAKIAKKPLPSVGLVSSQTW